MSLTKQGYCVDKIQLDSIQLLDIKKKLQATPLRDTKYVFNNDSSYKVYNEDESKIYIPKMFGISYLGIPNVTSEFIGKKWNHEIDFKGTLLNHQINPATVLLENCTEKLGGILTLGTGQGKTVTLLYCLSKLKGKTIIIVNKVPLMNQWIKEIKTFLPTARVGIIKGKEINTDCDIVIAMLQSISRIDYPAKIFKDFMITVVDECHNVASQIFSKTLFKICSYYTIGLSATPQRGDGCEYVFKWHLGEIVYESKNEIKGKPPIVSYMKINSEDYKEICTENRFTGQKQIQFTSMLTDLVMMEKRNLLIVDTIKDLVSSSEKRKILVLSDRRNHLQLIKKLLDNDNTVTFTYGLFLGGMKTSELDKSRECTVILGTYQAFGEGVSEKNLNTLLLITPKKFIGHLKNDGKNESGKLEQIVGRIFRKEHIEEHPLIIDFQDNFSIYKNQSSQRRVFYKKHFKDLIEKFKNIELD